MKKIFLLSGLILSLGSACDKPDDTPPRKTTYESNYVLPEAFPLTEQEKEIVEERNEEYENSIKSLK